VADTYEGWAILELMGHRRLGRFVVTRKQTKAKTVSFETAPGIRIAIKPIEDAA
jgi:hypothetical protein